MKKDILVAPSILSADFTRLHDEIKKVETSGADMIHIDVMDGQFVPNITVGPLIVRAVRRCTDLPLDVHLMIERPERYIREFIEAGSDIITVHIEVYGVRTNDETQVAKKGSSKAVEKIDREKLTEVLTRIKSYGKRAGLSLNPGSHFCIHELLNEVDMLLIMSVHPGFGGQKFISGVLPKIREARRLYPGDIEVDGGINAENAKMVVNAGANILVAGSYFFEAKNSVDAVKRLKQERV